MKLSAWVRAARKHGKLTQEDLAELLSLTKSNVSAWENGRHEPSFGQLQAISKRTRYPLPNDGEPQKPGMDFRDRHEVSESDWATLQAVKLMLSERELDDIRARAAQVEAQVEERLAATIGKAK